MSKNTGIPYETLTQHIFDTILNQDYAKTIDVKHDVVLQGKTVSHQIDIYWKFEVGGIQYTTIVQTKDWSSTVEQGALILFKGVIDDLPDQPRGIFVTRTGYQIGAKEYAKKNGIILFELHEQDELDLEHRIKNIKLCIHGFIPYAKDIKLIFDNEWAVKESNNLNISNDRIKTIQISIRTNEIVFYDENDQPFGNVKGIFNSYIPTVNKEMPPINKSYHFEQPIFVNTNISDFPKMKIHSIEATIGVSKIDKQLVIDGEDIVGFIFRNVLEEKDLFYYKNVTRI